jgi:hypothetical protein
LKLLAAVAVAVALAVAIAVDMRALVRTPWSQAACALHALLRDVMDRMHWSGQRRADHRRAHRVVLRQTRARPSPHLHREWAHPCKLARAADVSCKAFAYVRRLGLLGLRHANGMSNSGSGHYGRAFGRWATGRASAGLAGQDAQTFQGQRPQGTLSRRSARSRWRGARLARSKVRSVAQRGLSVQCWPQLGDGAVCD